MVSYLIDLVMCCKCLLCHIWSQHTKAACSVDGLACQGLESFELQNLSVGWVVLSTARACSPQQQQRLYNQLAVVIQSLHKSDNLGHVYYL